MIWLTDLTELLRKGEAKEIEGRRCFIVDETSFFKLRKAAEWISGTPDSDLSLRRRYGLENFLLRLSSDDEFTYTVCMRARPVLDELWESMCPENLKEKEQP